jgi:hypothetical protein
VLIKTASPEGGYDLTGMRVMHMLHPLESTPGSHSTTVRKGFKWAEMAGAGLFLCVCSAPCKDPELCGRLFWDERPASGGKRVTVKMPWTVGEDSEELKFAIWCCDNCRVQGTGAVLDTWVGRFYDIPARLLQYEHERRSRDYAGLLASMRKAYGDTFGEASFVTVVLYRRVT